jgi:hypothetical protein
VERGMSRLVGMQQMLALRRGDLRLPAISEEFCVVEVVAAAEPGINGWAVRSLGLHARNCE